MIVRDILLANLDAPDIGQDVYFPTRLFISRGLEDTIGGLGKVCKVERKFNSVFVYCEELPGVGRNWEILKQDQAKLRDEFGTSRCYPDPDDRPSMNTLQI